MVLQTKIIAIAVLIAFSAFFSATELAFFSLSKLKVKYLISKKIANADIVEKLKSRPTKLLVTVLICNNVVSVGASVLATSVAYELSLSYAVAIVTGIMTLILLLFGEIMPKAFAVKYNEKISLWVARPLLILQILLSPLTFLFVSLTNFLIKSTRKKPLLTEEELKAYVSVGEEVGLIKNIEKKMIDGIFKFSNLEAKDIMIPEDKIIRIDVNGTVEQAAKILIEAGKSRLPVYETRADNLNWFIHVNDVQKLLLLGEKNSKINKIKRRALVVSPLEKIDRLLQLMQQKRQHIVIVTDESGRSVGLVSIEDIVEEIVGELFDEMKQVGN